MIRFLIIFLISFSSFARTVYITDEIDIPIRSDKSFENNIIRSAPSGTKMDIVQIDNDGWTKITFENTTGWIISRYLSNNPPARIQLDKLQKSTSGNEITIKRQLSKIKELEEELKDIKKSNKDNKIAALKAQAEKHHIEKTYAESLAIKAENNQLKQDNLNLKSQIKLLEIGDTNAIEDSNRLWFIYGGLVMFFGVLIGFVFSRKRR